MKKRYLPFTVPKWFLLSVGGLLLFIFILFVIGIFVYSDIQDKKLEGFDQSKQEVLQNTSITTIDQVSRYHGKILYHVVTGKTEEGTSAIAYVPKGVDKSILFFSTGDFIDKDDILAGWESDCSTCKLVGINYAIDKEIPLLEIKYIDNKDRYVFEYFSLEDGSSYEQLRLKRSLY